MPLHRLDRNKSREEIKRCRGRDIARSWPGERRRKDAQRAYLEACRSEPAWRGPWCLSRKSFSWMSPPAGWTELRRARSTTLLMKVKTERHTTMVIVTHDIHGARKIADKFAVLDQGRLLAFGTPEELDKQQDNRLQQFISE